MSVDRWAYASIIAGSVFVTGTAIQVMFKGTAIGTVFNIVFVISVLIISFICATELVNKMGVITMRLFGGWAGMSRREENHSLWEQQDTRGAIKAKAREAQRQASEKQNKAKAEAKRAAGQRATSARRVRNNRREY